MSFILRMAWRDSRSSRRRLAVFSLSIVLGVAAIVAIGSFGDSLQQAIGAQARSLLGADLVVSSRQPFSPEAERYLGAVGDAVSWETNFSSMIVVPKAGGATRLVQVRALEGGFPFYGEFTTEPAAALDAYRAGRAVIVEESLLLQFGLAAGDTIRLGSADFIVGGSLQRIAGETAVFGQLAPRVLIPRAEVARTGLLQPGAIVRYKAAVRLPGTPDLDALVRTMRERFAAERWGFETVAERQRDLGRAMENIQAYLRLTGFIALVLGGVGIASAIHVHIRQKLPTVAVLRCLGARPRTALAIYLVQGLALGLGGAGIGAVLGVLVQTTLPRVLAEVVPFPVEFAVSWSAVAKGVGAGLAIGGLFSLAPLLAVRRVSPLSAVRAGYEAGRPRGWRDPAVLAVGAAIAAGVAGLALAQSADWRIGLGFAGALGVVFGALVLVSRGLMVLARRLSPRRAPYVWRQGLANLHRPQNRTGLLLLSLGLGTFLVATLHLTRGTLLAQFEAIGSGERPNLAFFDIQDDQRDLVARTLAEAGTPVMQEAALVTMRLAGLKGRPVSEILLDPKSEIPAWTLRREYRSTYRSTLTETEVLTAGRWTGEVAAGQEPVPVSVEEGLARNLGLGLGDELVFDVQGVPVRCVVGSLRRVDWHRIQPNFFVVFPAGVLEGAPKFHIMVARAAGAAASAELQRRVVAAAPNVSAIDLSLILETFTGLIGKVAYVVRFMALFTVATGIVVLAGAVLTGRFQRIREAVLLRTLGATRRQVRHILTVEYAILGLLAALAGAGLAVGANWCLAHFVFEAPWRPPGAEIGAVVAAVVALTLTTGLLSNRGVCDHPPLQVLRQET